MLVLGSCLTLSGSFYQLTFTIVRGLSLLEKRSSTKKVRFFPRRCFTPLLIHSLLPCTEVKRGDVWGEHCTVKL